MKSGVGVLYLPDGTTIKGSWVADRLHGPGLIVREGKIHKATWHYDILLPETKNKRFCNRAPLNLFFCIAVLVFVILALAISFYFFIAAAIFYVG